MSDKESTGVGFFRQKKFDSGTFCPQEIITINDPSTLKLARPLPLAKGQQVEVLVLATGKDQELENIRDLIADRGATESDIDDAVAWARASS